MVLIITKVLTWTNVVEVYKLLKKQWIKINGKCIKGSSHYLGDKQDFDVLREGPSSSTNSRRRAFAQNVEILFIALVVSRSFDTFAAVYPLLTLATV